ncbi:MAG: hypothetical protein AVDCRST_MAG04-2116, partial [uncultured Acetobacteraceae bacterium]
CRLPIAARAASGKAAPSRAAPRFQRPLATKSCDRPCC